MDMPLEDFGKSEECRPKAEPCKHYWILSIDENDIKVEIGRCSKCGIVKRFDTTQRRGKSTDKESPS